MLNVQQLLGQNQQDVKNAIISYLKFFYIFKIAAIEGFVLGL